MYVHVHVHVSVTLTTSVRLQSMSNSMKSSSISSAVHSKPSPCPRKASLNSALSIFPLPSGSHPVRSASTCVKVWTEGYLACVVQVCLVHQAE